MPSPLDSESESHGRWLDWNVIGVFGGFWALITVATYFVEAPWLGFHGVLLGVAGLLMLYFPPTVDLPRLWWFLTAAFVILGAGSFLPAAWFYQPPWRANLEALGVQTGSLVTIQAQQAIEAFLLFILTLLGGLWLAGHRTSAVQLRLWALAFNFGVAGYAILSKVFENSPYLVQTVGKDVYGFYPNRNHTASYLAMGAVCGLGCIIQAVRDRRFLVMDAALVATGICFWAITGWSTSRGGVVLVAVGSLIWLATLRRRYLGRQGWIVLGFIVLAVAGLFYISESEVKSRLVETAEDVLALRGPKGNGPAAGPLAGKPQGANREVDFRIPTALDTFDLLNDFKWTGIGAGQFLYVFPQYRQRSAVGGANDKDHYHPESDWLWLAAEVGLPATLMLAALVVSAGVFSLRAIVNGRDRALRSACLVAAMLVPFHGLFDVPGHRPTLAWAAAFLYVLSLPPPPVSNVTGRDSARFLGWIGAPMLLVATALISAQWLGRPQPAFTAADSALATAKSLWEQAESDRKTAPATGTNNPSPIGRDHLEKAIAVLERAAKVAPLDRRLQRYKTFMAFYLGDKHDLIDRAFAVEQGLDPTWVMGPMQQAANWAKIDPERTSRLWKEAYRRAENLDQRSTGRFWKKRVLENMEAVAAQNPGLKKFLPAPE